MFGPEQITGGAENDLVQVNRIARKMVYRLGMGEQTGFLIHDEQSVPLSADAAATMDAEVQGLLARLYERARAILSDNRPALEALAQALLQRETIDGSDALDLLQANGVELPGRMRVKA